MRWVRPGYVISGVQQCAVCGWDRWYAGRVGYLGSYYFVLVCFICEGKRPATHIPVPADVEVRYAEDQPALPTAPPQVSWPGHEERVREKKRLRMNDYGEHAASYTRPDSHPLGLRAGNRMPAGLELVALGIRLAGLGVREADVALVDMGGHGFGLFFADAAKHAAVAEDTYQPWWSRFWARAEPVLEADNTPLATPYPPVRRVPETRIKR